MYTQPATLDGQPAILIDPAHAEVSSRLAYDQHLPGPAGAPDGYPAQVIDVQYADEIVRIEDEERERELRKKKESERLVQGLDDVDLNALLTVFEKQIHHVHIKPPLRKDKNVLRLDLEPSPDEEFIIDKLRSNLERFYAGIVVGMGRALVEVQRIRHWEEGGSRTASALFVYTIAWGYNLIISTFLIFISLNILSPQFRDLCFHVTSRPPSGPAANQGKATDWAQSIQDMFTPAGSGSGGKNKAEEMVQEEVNGVMVKDMKETKEKKGDEKVEKKDVAIEMYGLPAMKIIGGLADKWERIANSLNPTPPFLMEPHRIRVVYLLVLPSLFLSTFISERLFSRVIGFSFGVFLFGQPMTSRVIAELDQRIPNWREKLILENNILSDVPTNSQLILRLLRDAEHKRRPLPPTDDIGEDPDMSDEDNDHENGNDTGEEEDEDEDDPEIDGDLKAKMENVEKKMSGMKAKMSNGLRSKARRAWDKAGQRKEEGFAWVTGHKKVDYEGKARNALDKLNVSPNRKSTKAVLRKLPSAPDEDSPDNPSRFYVHHEKHGPGHLILYPPTLPDSHDPSSFTPARLIFTTIRNVPASQIVPLDTEDSPSRGHLTISINDVISIKKEGMGLVGRTLTSWALDAEGAGGTGLEIEIVRRGGEGDRGEEEGEVGRTEMIKLRGIVRRNELFNRLVSLGEQQWETL